MTETIVVLTEEPLNSSDVRNLARLQGEEPATYVVLVPEDTHRNLLADFLDNLSLLDFGQAFRELVQGQPSPQQARTAADEALAASLNALAEAGLTAEGRIAGDDPIPSLVEAVTATDAGQAVVITTPHALADTFHVDWANKAQDRLGVPVLHLYSGSGYIGDS